MDLVPSFSLMGITTADLQHPPSKSGFMGKESLPDAGTIATAAIKEHFSVKLFLQHIATFVGWQFPELFRCLLPEDLVGLAVKEGGIILSSQIHPFPCNGKNYILQDDSSGIKLISHLIWAD